MQAGPERLDVVANVSRRTLIALTVLLETGLFLASALVMWITGLRPAMSTTGLDVLIGVIVGVGLALGVVLATRFGTTVLGQLRRDFDLVIALFRDLSLAEIALISALAGIGEEMFFRGLLQTWLTDLIGLHVAVLLVAITFGLLHTISRSYAVYATILGLALGYLYHYTGSLPATILTHGVYDFVAILYGTRVLAQHSGGTEVSAE